MTDPYIQIHPCLVSDLEHLNKCAAEDGHVVISPSFLVLKGEQTVGYLGVLPTITAWFDTHRCNMRDALMAQNFWENYLRQQASVIGVACTPQSPFFPLLPKVGYVDSNSTMFMKSLQRRS